MNPSRGWGKLRQLFAFWLHLITEMNVKYRTGDRGIPCPQFITVSVSAVSEEMLPSSISVLHPLFFPVKQCSQFNRTKKERRYGINKSSYKGLSQ